METTKYYGTYTDDFGTASIIIENDFNNISTEIDGVKFSGSEFSVMAIIDKSNYPKQRLERFTFSSFPIFNTNTNAECLCNCSFEITIMVTLIDKINQTESAHTLTIDYKLGKERPKPRGGIEFEEVKLSLLINGNIYEGTNGFFEYAFDQIRKQIQDKYQFKNCYGCMYGDYSVYGQSSFGTMLCFVLQKEKYKEVANKDDYMKLRTDEINIVQEIYCCDEYEIRKNGTGYRG